MFDTTLTLKSQTLIVSLRLGQLHLNSGGMCPDRLRKDLDFWQISEFLLGKKKQHSFGIHASTLSPMRSDGVWLDTTRPVWLEGDA